MVEMSNLGVGTLLKMRGKLADKVEYKLPLSALEIDLNLFLGKKIALNHTGNIYCIATGDKIKKTYNQGYSYRAFISLAQCDMCIVKPEKCHFHLGTCREPEWGEKHCFQPHFVYLSQTSNLKVGITRKPQVPTRWIDQGANFAIKLFEVKDRLTSGKIEVMLKSELSDKTNWRKMLQSCYEDQGLEKLKKKLVEKYLDKVSELEAEVCKEPVQPISYPILEYPEKVKSIGFDKMPEIEGKLLGIKGQYLMLDCGVINIRKHQGYEIEFFAEA